MFTEISSTLVSTLIPNLPMWIWYAAIFVTALLIFIITYFYFGSTIIATMFMLVPFIFGVIIGVIPLWMIIIVMVYGAYSFLFHSTQPVPESQDIDAWDEYGNKLKQAYSAKFGGENTGFNEEVEKESL